MTNATALARPYAHTASHTDAQNPEPINLQSTLIGASYWTVPGAIEADDLLQIDPQATAIDTAGFYLLQRQDGAGQPVWKGCRRFSFSLTGSLMVDEGDGPVQATNMSAFQIMGRVQRIYKAAALGV